MKPYITTFFDINNTENCKCYEFSQYLEKRFFYLASNVFFKQNILILFNFYFYAEFLRATQFCVLC